MEVSETTKTYEVKSYKKGLRLQRFIKESISQNENEINWKKMQSAGQFSNRDEEMFATFLV